MSTIFKLKAFSFSTLLFAFALIHGCSNKSGCMENVYSFNLGIKASPNFDSILLNDTLWFTINENTDLLDNFSNRIISFRNASNLSFVFGIFKVLGPQLLQDGAKDFDYVIRKGATIQSANANFLREFKLAEENNRYLLEVGFVARGKGIFRVLTENAGNVYVKTNTCDRASFAVKYLNTNQHFYLGYNLSGEGVYYFKVY